MKNYQFSSVRKIIEEYQNILGVIVLRNPNKRISKWKKIIFNLMFSTYIASFIILMVSTLIETKLALLNLILCGSLTMIKISFFNGVYRLITNEDDFNKLLNWCEKIYKVDGIEKNKLMGKVIKIMKGFRLLCYCDILTLTLGITIVGYFLPDNIYPKYTVPAPFYLLFNNQKTWIAFFTTLLFQFKVGFDGTSMLILIYGLIFCFTFHIHEFLKLIELKVQQLTDKEKFIQNIAIITDMINDVNAIVNIFEKLFTQNFLLLELATLASLFGCGLVLTVVKQQYLYGIGLTIITLVLFLVCYINEKILDAYENIQDAFYDLPWYDFPVKQQKLLLILLNCQYIQGGFTANGINYLNLDRFAIIVKVGYSNLLTLKELVEK